MALMEEPSTASKARPGFAAPLGSASRARIAHKEKERGGPWAMQSIGSDAAPRNMNIGCSCCPANHFLGAETGVAEPHVAEQSRSWRAASGVQGVMRGS
jgi:hypothetical protein